MKLIDLTEIIMSGQKITLAYKDHIQFRDGDIYYTAKVWSGEVKTVPIRYANCDVFMVYTNGEELVVVLDCAV